MKQSEALDMITKIQLAHQAIESACKRIDELKEENENLKEALTKQKNCEPQPALYVKDIDGNFHLHKEKGHTEKCAAFGDDCSENHLSPSRFGVGKNNSTTKQEQGGWHTHDLYTDEDKDRPDVICDINGQVVLGLCKRCGRGEAQLETPCDKPKHCEYCKRGLKTMCLCGLNPKQEQGKPVAWMHKETALLRKEINKPKGSDWDADHWIPLYTKPQPKQEHGEPVSWESVLGAVARGWCYEENANKTMDSELAVAIAKEVHALYTTPQQRKPLTDEQIKSIAYDCNALPEAITDETLIIFARALWVIYGIKE
jgi:hypothetical protein